MLQQLLVLVTGSPSRLKALRPAAWLAGESHTGSRHRRLRIEPLEDRQLLSVTPAGGEFRVNTTTISPQKYAGVAVDADGRRAAKPRPGDCLRSRHARVHRRRTRRVAHRVRLNLNSATPGVLRLSLAGNAALSLPHGAIGELLLLEFRVLAGSGTSSPLNLLARSADLETALYDELGRPLTLSPAPTNESFDAVDGRVEILPDGWAQAVDDVLATAAFDGDE